MSRLHKNCKNCGNKFYKTPNVGKPEWFGNKKRLNGVLYCSRECSDMNTLFKKGQTPWNKGLKGYRAGVLNNNWKGGITPENTKVRDSLEYKEWRTSVFDRDDYTCQECGQRGGVLNAHHIKEFSNYEELRLVLENGITLCKACHHKAHEHIKPRAVLNEHQVRRMRLLKEVTPEITLKKLASLFGIDDYTAGDVFRGVTWQGVT